MKVTGITVELMVMDVDSSVEFYRDVLGFNLLAREDDDGKSYWAKMELNGFSLSFKAEDRMKSEVAFMREQSIGGSTALCFQVEDLEGYHGKVETQCEMLNLPHPTPCGATQFSMKDNSGYILTFERF